ncbi:hypothetical protein GCM10023194_44360 [Planotetraspora phitsanulokensis]|uniref:Uncharacterized protein n=2 Tax=Planotetraspora phitsanulokensis TaxID=575192 RepID=A0A8J3U3R6_9ACTN|nr:hypothetical protein Pph01_30410 [Planotetraspora phitsanulokensis]
MRGRCVVLAAVTAGVSWLATGHAMADGATVAGPCKPQKQSSPANLSTLTPPNGVLSIADTAGAAAGQGLTSMPGRPSTPVKGGTAQGVQGASGKSAPGRPRTLPAAPDASTVLPALPDGKKAPAGAQSAAETAQSMAKGVPAEMPNPAPAVDAAQSVAKQAAMGASAATAAAQPAAKTPAVPLMAIAPAKPSVMHQACTPEAAVAGNQHNPKGRHAEGHSKDAKSSSRTGAEFLPAHPNGRPHHKVPPTVTQPGDRQQGGQSETKPAGPGKAGRDSDTQENAGAKAKHADQGRHHDADAKTRSTEGADTRTGVVHPKAPAHPNGAVPNDLTAPALAKAADARSVTRLANNATDSTILP